MWVLLWYDKIYNFFFSGFVKTKKKEKKTQNFMQSNTYNVKIYVVCALGRIYNICREYKREIREWLVASFKVKGCCK